MYLFFASVLQVTLHLLFASSFTSAATWSSSPIKIEFDYRLIDSPSSDVHVTSGLPMTCPGSSSSSGEVYAGGQSSGNDCFDSSTKTLQYSNFCRLFCQSDETLTSTGITKLKTALNEIGTAAFPNSPLQVRFDENTTISFQSDIFRSCDGMKILTPITHHNTNLLVIVTSRPLRQVGIPRLFSQHTFCETSSVSGRPTVVRFNINPVLINSYDQTQLTTMLTKEIIHVLGFSEHLITSFRFPSSSVNPPNLTYYQYDSIKYSTGPFSGSRIVNSVGGNFSISSTRSSQKIFFHGPATMMIASTFFSCSSILSSGVELENGGEPISTIMNLEKRIFPNEMMIADWNGTKTATSAASLFYGSDSSSLTLALLHDTGFYSVPQFRDNNYSLSALKFGGNFGRGLGCTFAQGRCIPDWPAGYTCDSPGGGGCSFDDERGQCDIRTYSTPLDSNYQYFTDPTQGGADVYADFCPRIVPLPDSADSGNSNCKVPLAAAPATSNLVTTRGMSFGSVSKCAISRIVKSGLAAPTVSYASCFPVVCDVSSSSVGSYFLVGSQELARCSQENEIVELFPPPRPNSAYTPPLQLAASGATVFSSFLNHGLIACGNIPSQCQSDVTGMPRLSKPNPVVTKISPSWAPLAGDVSIEIIGNGFTGCLGVRIGNVAVSDFRVVNDTFATGRTGRVDVSNLNQGGSNADGQGEALVQVLCPIPSLAASPEKLCTENSGGCIVSRASGLFNYSNTDPNAAPPPPPETTPFDFFLTGWGKAIGFCLSLLTTALMAVAVRKLMNFLHGVVDETTFRKKKKNKNGDLSSTDGKKEGISIVEDSDDEEDDDSDVDESSSKKKTSRRGKKRNGSISSSSIASSSMNLSSPLLAASITTTDNSIGKQVGIRPSKHERKSGRKTSGKDDDEFTKSLQEL